MSAAPPSPSFVEALRVWIRIALLSFGGPAAQISVMHRILVEEKAWLDEKRFLHALNFCMLLPGPEAMQLATYSGWLMNRTAGGLAAGLLFVLPGFVSILALSMLYAGFRDATLIQGLFYGIQAAVLAVVLEALIRIGRRTLRTPFLVTAAALAFAAIFIFDVPFPAIIAAAGLAGAARWLLGRPLSAPETDIPDLAETSGRASLSGAMRTVVIWGGIWLLPAGLLTVLLGPDDIFVQMAWFFGKLATVSFGGAYAVLAYVTQEAVQTHGWLTPEEMLDGLGMAETTPGPLIQVVQFVGFMGAYHAPGSINPYLAGTLASIVVTWMTFAPCFLWIFLGAPFMERLRRLSWLTGALETITAAVVGVILNLAVWFGLHVLFAEMTEKRAGPAALLVPEVASFELAALLISLACFAALTLLKRGMILVIVAAGAVGALLHLS